MEFLNLGKHCEYPGCNQRDFLPFTCDCCTKVFCLAHRTYRTHECPVAGSRDTHAIQCPFCAGSIRVVGTEDANVAFERHRKELCHPERRKERKHKKRCGAKSCHAKLTLTNTIVCDVCQLKVCLTHRYPDAHNCPGSAASQRAARGNFLSRFTTSSGTKPKPKPKPKAKAKKPKATDRWGRAQQDPANTLVGSAARRMRGHEAAAAAAAAPAPVAAAAPAPASVLAGAGSGREVCPTCQARFQQVTDLVAHVESWHSGAPSGAAPAAAAAAGTGAVVARPAAAAGGGAGGAVPCPRCGASFYDPVQLVDHCENGRCPQTRRQSSCMVS